MLKAGEDYVELDNDLTELVQGRSVPRIKLTQKLENEILSRCLGSHWSDICFNFNYCCVLYMNIDEKLNHAIKNVFYIQRTKCVHLSEK